MTTLADLINETHRRLEPLERTITLQLPSLLPAIAVTVPFNDYSNNGVNSAAMIPNTIISIDLELMLVLGPISNGAVPVQRGYRGSQIVQHAAGALIYVRPRYSDFDILTAINHDLDDLCSPLNGLFSFGQIQVAYSPVYEAYDLTDVVSGEPIVGYIDTIAVRFKTPLPDRRRRAIPDTRFEVEYLGGTDVDTSFPSGYALNIFPGDRGESAWPGLPVLLTFKQAFQHLANYSDVVETAALLPTSMTDLPPLGAMLQLVAPREIQRNQTDAQPDSRLAPEVPPGSVMNSVAGVMRQRTARITAESAKLKALVGRMRTRF